MRWAASSMRLVGSQLCLVMEFWLLGLFFCYWLHSVPKHVCQLCSNKKAFLCPGCQSCCLQALRHAEDSFVPAPGHLFLLFCQGPARALIAGSGNCLQVTKPAIAASRESEPWLEGFCFIFFGSLLFPSTDWKIHRSVSVQFSKESNRTQRKTKPTECGGQAGFGASSPMKTGINVTHSCISAGRAFPAFPASKIIYCSEMTQWP